MSEYKLRYIGANPRTDWLPGIPASDHTVATRVEAKARVATGLYELVKPPKAAKKDARRAQEGANGQTGGIEPTGAETAEDGQARGGSEE